MRPPGVIFLSEGLLRARFDAPDGVSRSDASSNQPFRGRISNYWLSEGLFRASFEAPSRGALGGCRFVGVPSEGLFRLSFEAPSGGALGGVA